MNPSLGRRPPTDPRTLVNAHGYTAAAVALQHGAGAALAEALLPGVPVGRIVDVASLVRWVACSARIMRTWLCMV